MSDREERDARALELRRAGLSPGRIAIELGAGSAKVVNGMVSRALARSSGETTLAEARALEMDRLDRLLQGVWVRAARGDTAALDRAVALSQLRMRLAGAPEGERRMRKAYDETVAALTTTPMDQALIEGGRLICDQMDAAAVSGDLTWISKAIYLIPHLVNVLRELGATPAMREAVTGQSRLEQPKENELAEFKRKRRLGT